MRPNMCVFFPFLSGAQKVAWERYLKTKEHTIAFPLWCHSAIKTKEFTENTIKMLRQMSPEALKQLQQKKVKVKISY
jgi:hypothetical protein